MRRLKQLGTYGLLGFASYFASACCPPENISVLAARLNGKCELDIDYEGTALGVYVMEQTITSPKSDKLGEPVVFPRSNSKFDGIVFFGLDTTTFPDGIVPPVRYGDTEKDRAVDTENAYMHSDNIEHNGGPMNPVKDPSDPTGMKNYLVDPAKGDVPENQLFQYAQVYPMPLENADNACKRCQLSQPTGDSALPAPMQRGVGTLHIGVVTVPGNSELDVEEFFCPASGSEQFGTDLSAHFGVD